MRTSESLSFLQAVLDTQIDPDIQYIPVIMDDQVRLYMISSRILRATANRDSYDTADIRKISQRQMCDLRMGENY